MRPTRAQLQSKWSLLPPLLLLPVTVAPLKVGSQEWAQTGLGVPELPSPMVTLIPRHGCSEDLLSTGSVSSVTVLGATRLQGAYSILGGCVHLHPSFITAAAILRETSDPLDLA